MDKNSKRYLNFMILNKRKISDYTMVLLLIFISGNLAFTNKIILFSSFILSGIFFFYRRCNLDKSFIYWITILVTILLLQSIKFNFFPYITYLGVFIRISIAYFILKGVGDSFIPIFISIMRVLATISLLFLVLIQIIPGLDDFLIQHFSVVSITGPFVVERHNILGIYTIIPMELFKNAGAFWEMGAFGGYLILALMFSLIRNNKLVSQENLIFIIAILTTQSTTAYIAFFVLLSLFYYQSIKNIIFKLLLLVIISLSAYYAYINFDFLGKKIEHQLKNAQKIRILTGKEDSQRFINILKDWHDFQGHEIIGRGPHSLTRYSIQAEHQIRTVGSTDMIVRFGLPFFILTLYILYKSISSYIKYSGINNTILEKGVIVVILILLMSETYFLLSFFWSLLMLQHIYIKEEEQ